VLGLALRYTAARLLLMGLVAAVLFLVGFRGWPLAFGAVIVSLPLSWFVLRKQRESLAGSWAARSAERAEQKAKLQAALNGNHEEDS
jgi:hypothetical protein